MNRAGLLTLVGLCVGLLAGARSASAAMSLYPALDQSYSAPGGTAVSQSTADVPLNAGTGVFTDPDTGSPTPSANRYYGGLMSYSPNQGGNWGGSIVLSFLRANGQTTPGFGKPEGADNWTFASDGWGPSANTGIAANGLIPFVVKFSDTDWNIARAQLFIGSNATSATEGTADADLQLTDAVAGKDITALRLSFTAADWASGASSGSLSGLFSATEWTAVTVPEPAGLSLLAMGAVALLLRRRGRRA